MAKNYVVVGAGFRGFCDTVELLKRAGNRVHIVDSAPFFGGVMNSFETKGFYVDKGVHVFDSVPKPLAEIVSEIMHGKIREIDFTSASVYNGKVSEGFSLPDLSSIDQKTQGVICQELVRLASCPPTMSPHTLNDLFQMRYGATASKIYSNIFKKVYSVDADKVEPSAMALTSLGRLKFLDDPEMMVLKAHSWLDTVLAARRKTLGKVDDLVSVYPDDGRAMTGWCLNTVEWLKAKGVQISLGEKILSINDNPSGVTVTTDKQIIEADQVIWANDNLNALGDALGNKVNFTPFTSGTPMVFITLITQANKIKDFTYLQNFDPEAVSYRTAAAGIFSNQIKPDGTSFLTCECPTQIGSAAWENPGEMIKKVWDDCLAYGVVASDATLVDSHAVRLPMTFKIPLSGYLSNFQEFSSTIKKHSSRTILRDVRPFFRRDIYLDSLKIWDVLEK